MEAPDTLKGLEEWREWGRRSGMQVDVVTQFCFESTPILGLIAELDRAGIELPVIVGLAGPATPATLTKFALRCGIGNSMRAVRSQIGRFGRLLTDNGPDEVVSGLRGARGCDGFDRRISPVPVRRLAQGRRLAAHLRPRPAWT